MDEVLIYKDDIPYTRKEFLGDFKKYVQFDTNFERYVTKFKTSGTTGKPKIAVHDAIKFFEKYKIKRPGYITLITHDLDRVGGFDALMRVFFYGKFAVIPTTKSPIDVMRAIEKYGVELLITSPSFMRFLLLCSYEEYELSSIKIVALGSEKLSKDLYDKIRIVFPNAKIKQTYGSSELGVLRTHSEGDLIKFVSDDVKVIDNILYIKSNTSFLGYEGESNPITDDGFYCTGDRVEIVGDYFRILGRGSSVINVGGYKVQPEEVEDVLLQVCYDALVYGEPNNLLGNIIVADVVCNYSVEDIKEYCKERLEKYKIPMKINFVDHIEYTENGKRRRK